VTGGGPDRRNDRMVDALVRAGAIRDGRVERAFRALPRHWFLPGAPVDDVYLDRAVVTHRRGDGVPISSSTQPALMAGMLHQLAVEPGMTVLEIGAGTGYNAALLGHLVGPAGRVVTVDVDPDITGAAEQHLAAAGTSNVTVVTGDGWAGAPYGEVFDRVVATVGVWDVSPAWVAQLADGGMLVVPLWLRAGQQASVGFRRVGEGLQSLSVEPCGFMRMRGRGAGQPFYRRLGRWTVSLDAPDPDAERLLASLLEQEPFVRPAPQLPRGWFTPIALGQHHAVHLFTEGDRGPVIRAGILHRSPPGLAVVESNPLARPPVRETVRCFGSEAALDRLLDLLHREPPVDVSELVIVAVPTGGRVGCRHSLARLVRPAYTFVIGGGGPSPA
jgi:protein-L-isoaspartate(D-aspartate) O-methyltransferase